MNSADQRLDESADHPVLDMHVHPLLTESWEPGTVEFVRSINPGIVEETRPFTDPAYMREHLDTLGVSHAVFLAEEAPDTSGMVRSEAVQDYVAGIRGFHFFASINPVLESDPCARLRALLERGPVAGVKLMPTYQHFHPADKSIYPLYALIEELGIPCTFHTGLSRIPRTRLRYADPLLLDDVAVDFPGLPILLAHAGRGVWYEQAALLAGLHPNVYLEISGLPPQNLPVYFPRLERLADKMVFGSDWPGLPSLAANVEAVKEVFGDDTARSVLWETGARLLGLER